MVQRLSREVLSVAAPVMLAALLVGGPAGEWTFALASALFPIPLIALSVAGTRCPRLLVGVLAALGLLLGGGVTGILILSGNPSLPRILGLPPATLLMFLVLGLAPLVLVIWAYAATFDRLGATTERIERIASFEDPGPRCR